MKKLVRDALMLTMITLVAGFLLGVVYEITKEPIKAEQERAKQEAYQNVFQDADHFEAVKDADFTEVLKAGGFEAQIIEEAAAAKDGAGESLGYVYTVVSKEGYGGDIRLTVGIQEDGTVNGISILEISETAGLGMKADTEEFQSQYADKKVDAFVYTKNGASAENEIDAISGATITTNAVTNGVNAAICAFDSMKGGEDS